jgi:hypothetical protein
LTARETLLWFGTGVPIICILLVLVDRAFSTNGGRFVPRRYDAETQHRSEHRSRDDAPTVVPEPEPVAAPDAVHVHGPVPKVHALVASLRPPRPVRKPWAPGDGLRRPIAGGAAPSAATVRKRAWTTYSVIAPVDIFGIINAERLERGRPPLRYNPLLDAVEPMQLDIDDVGRVRVHWNDAEDVVDPYEITRAR